MSEHLIEGVAHIGIRVKDLETSRAFYEKLGFEFILGPVGPEPVAMMKHPGGVEINLILNADDEKPHNVLMDANARPAGYTHVALLVPDADLALAHLQREGITLSGGPNQYPDGAKGMFIRDPDRNVVELYQAASARS